VSCVRSYIFHYLHYRFNSPVICAVETKRQLVKPPKSEPVQHLLTAHQDLHITSTHSLPARDSAVQYTHYDICTLCLYSVYLLLERSALRQNNQLNFIRYCGAGQSLHLLLVHGACEMFALVERFNYGERCLCGCAAFSIALHVAPDPFC
jgi:hypothetical protein